MFDDSIVLNNGVKIPQLGLGIWFIDEDKTADAVKSSRGQRLISAKIDNIEGNRAASPVVTTGYYNYIITVKMFLSRRNIYAL